MSLHQTESKSSVYAASEKQEAEIALLGWVKKLDISPVPEQYRYQFVNRMVKQNFERMVVASKFGAIVIAALILAVDVMNISGMTHDEIMSASFAHIALFVSLVCGYIVGKRVDIGNSNNSIAVFFLWSNLFRSLYFIFGFFIFYNIGKSGENIAGPFAVLVGLLSAGLYANKSFILLIGSINAVIYTGVVLATSPNMQVTSNELFCGYAVIAIAAFSSILLFQSFRQEFAMTKKMEEERRKSDDLNAQLSGANEEIGKQIELLSEQAREIEITNTTLQEKTIELEQERSTLENLNSALNIEQHKSEELLHNILPRSIAQRLKSGEENIANHFENVTVLFADIVGFTRLSAERSAWEIVNLLNRIFSAFDIFSEQYNLEKIKTIGDAYMIVGGLPEARADHAEAVAKMAIEMLATVELLSKTMDTPIALRIGIHSGAVVAGVIGKKKFAYDLWGDTVNTASRMESHGEAGKIHVSEEVFEALKKNFVFEERSEMEVKGIGMMRTWFLTGSVL